MRTPAEVPGDPTSDICAEQRVVVADACREAHEARAGHEAASEHVRDLRRALTAAGHREAEAVAAADPRGRQAEKAAARDAYQLARMAAKDATELREATATWARALDRVNRAGRLALRAVSAARAEVGRLETALHEAERGEQRARIKAEQAEAACLDARVQLAACEEGAEAPPPVAAASVHQPHAATAGHAVAIVEGEHAVPLVVESMVSGDRRALELAAMECASHAGISPAEAQLQLQELVAAIVSSAAEEGYLVFDQANPFWAHLSFEEARDVVAALARLGFQFEPSEGWHAARAPTPADLAIALGYAGLDTRNMRGLPNAEELQRLPRSIGVEARTFLARQAPSLTVDQLVRALGRRAEPLEVLWNEWGQVRPILLADRHTLGSLPG